MAEVYRISGERLKGIADQARRLGEIEGELTPGQIVQTLEAVTTGGGASMFATRASGTIPTVYRGAASSSFTLNFTSGATGALQEG